MKIRTDFVTNSSSSNFIAWMVLSFDNGKELRLMGNDEWHGGEGSAIVKPETHYDAALDGSILRKATQESLQELILSLRISKDRETQYLFSREKEDILCDAKHLTSGKLMLWAHTNGEYFNDANPKDLLERFEIFDFPEFSFPNDYESVLQELRGDPDAALYTDASLQKIAKAVTARWDEHGSDTKITQTLSTDGLIDVDIQTGDGGFFEVKDLSQYPFEEGSGEYNVRRRMKKYGLTKDIIWKDIEDLLVKYKALINQPCEIEIEGKRFFYQASYEIDRRIEKLGGIPTTKLDSIPDYLVSNIDPSAPLSIIDEYSEQLTELIALCEQNPTIRMITKDRLSTEIEKRWIQHEIIVEGDLSACIRERYQKNPGLQKYLEQCLQYGFSNKDAFRDAVESLDIDASIDFVLKHFVVSSFDDKEKEAIIFQIEKRGGIVHDGMVKMADYLVICMRTPGGTKLQQALRWREKGVQNYIISDYQIKEAFEQTDPAELLRQRDEAIIRQEEEKKKAILKKAQEREKKRNNNV